MIFDIIKIYFFKFINIIVMMIARLLESGDAEELKPILSDQGLNQNEQRRGTGSYPVTPLILQDEQQLILQPIEFDHKHKNLYGYYALATAVLVLVNYLMLKERSCQISLANGIQSFDTYQSFHLMALIVSLIVFILSYFHFAVVLYEFKILYYGAFTLIFLCSILLFYSGIAITWTPCVSLATERGLARRFDTSGERDQHTIFDSLDTIGIFVFAFDLVAGTTLFMAATRYLINKG